MLTPPLRQSLGQDVVQARSAVHGIEAQLPVQIFGQAQRDQLGCVAFSGTPYGFSRGQAGTPMSAASIAQGTLGPHGFAAGRAHLVRLLLKASTRVERLADQVRSQALLEGQLSPQLRALALLQAASAVGFGHELSPHRTFEAK